MASRHSLLRLEEHRALSSISLSGKVLDLGGERGREYLSHVKGAFSVTTMNLDDADIIHDLEKPLPIPDASFDHALLINVLEHVYRYQELLREAARVVRPGGSLTIVVPFLFPIHPSPSDYWRFTEAALRRACKEAGWSVQSVLPLGSGVFAARYLLLDRLLPNPVRMVSGVIVQPLMRFSDAVFAGVSRLLGKQYHASDYALGYLVHAIR